MGSGEMGHMILIKYKECRKEVNTKFMSEIMHARTAQNKWFQNLVDIADDAWSKTHSPAGISGIERDALNYPRMNGT